jgi:peptidoglycan/xylan/chitin deacetylase (PgdA/CDA1 family)
VAGLSLVLVAPISLTACSGTPPKPKPAASGQGGGGSATPSESPSPSEVQNAFTSRVPHFGPQPTPQPITAPVGPQAPIYKRLPITAPIAFLTMDDGYEQLADAAQLMAAAHIPFTMFLIAPVASKNPAFFRGLVDQGGLIEDHTITHTDLKGKPYAFQHHEICDARTTLTNTFQRAPVFFRPPFGDYDQTTLRAVHDCGMRAAFYWSETVNTGTVYYQTSKHEISAGDIILMHFRPAFINDVIAALTAIHNAGLTPALLEDWVV